MKAFFRALLRSPSGLIGFGLLALMVSMAVLAPVLCNYAPDSQNLLHRLLPPLTSKDGQFYLLGTDELGRDVFSRLLYGSRISFIVGPLSVLFGALFGVPVGLIAGYYRGILDCIIMWLVDVQLAFPMLVIALCLVAVFSPSMVSLVLILAISSWLYFARVVRATVLSLRETEFIEAERAVGANDFKIILRHILPNVVSPIIVLASTESARRIIMESSLSFLGVGIQPPMVSLGLMLGSGRAYIQTAWWLGTLPGLFLAIAVLGINLFGSMLRDYFDPRTGLH
ncbi:MAG: ABC transporter permease [Dehalobacterium sp.]